MIRSEKGSSLILLLILVFVAVLVFFYKNFSNERNIFVTQSSLSYSADPIMETLQKLQVYLKVTAPMQFLQREWLEKESQWVPLSGQEFALASYKTAYVGVYPRDKEDFKTKIDQFFKNQGFVVNQLNLSKPGFLNLIPYEKGELKCIFSYGSGEPHSYFFCGRYDEEKDKLNQQFRLVVASKDELDEIVKVGKIIGDYASGGVGIARGCCSVAWVAVKDEGNWVKVYEGNGSMDCSTIKQYKIPKEIYDASSYCK